MYANRCTLATSPVCPVRFASFWLATEVLPSQQQETTLTTVPRPIALAQVPSKRLPDEPLRERVDFLFRNGQSPLYRLILAYRTGREPPP